MATGIGLNKTRTRTRKTSTVTVEKVATKKEEASKVVTVAQLAQEMSAVVKSKVSKIDVYNFYQELPLPKTLLITNVEDVSGSNKIKRVTGIDPDTNKLFEQYLPSALEFDTVVGKEREDLEFHVKIAKKKTVNTLISRTLGIYSGSDPELFILDKDGEVLPAFKFLPSKEEAEKPGATGHMDWPVCYWDGFQAEFITYSQQSCLDGLVSCLHRSLDHILKKAQKFDSKARLTSQPLFQIPLEVLEETDPKYVEFGCKPSMNAYGLSANLSNAKEITHRSAGFHLHFGINKSNLKVSWEDLVKVLDATVGVMTVSMFAKYDSPIRRQYYGLAGEYRLPAHGLEYRTLSSCVMQHPTIVYLVFDLARSAIRFANSGLKDLLEGTEEEVVEIIQSCDVEKAREYMKRNQDVLTGIIKTNYSQSVSDAAFQAFLNGTESILKDPLDMHKNWFEAPNWRWADNCAYTVKGLKF